MSSIKPLFILLAAAALMPLAACNTVQGVKQDASVVKDKAIEVKDKTVEGGKAVGQSVGSGLEKAGDAVKDAAH